MKVLHVATGFPYSYSGGITNYVRALVDAQRESGLDAEVLAGIGTDQIDHVREIASKLVPFSLNINGDDAEFNDRVIDICKQYDLVHFHMVIDFSSNLLLRLSKELKNYVVSLHDYFLVCPRVFMTDYKQNICHEVKIEKCNRCCGVLDRSDFLRKVSSKTGIILPRVSSRDAELRIQKITYFLNNANALLAVSNKVRDIYQGVAPNGKFIVEHIGNITALLNVPEKIPSEKIIIGMLGTLSYIKGASVVERILKGIDNDNIEFHFYGRADNVWLKRLEAVGLIYKGSYSQNDLVGIVSTMSLGLVSPIWEDNAPQVVMEMLNLGIPVIGSKRGGIVDFIKHNDNGYLFEPTSELEIKELCSWLNKLTLHEVSKLISGIKKLSTPSQHAHRVMEIYNDISNV